MKLAALFPAPHRGSFDVLEDLSLQPDGALVAACLAGQRECFDELVRRYRPALVRVAASRTGRSDWAEDVAQETCYSALKSLHTYDSRYSFRTWLWTILLNHCRRQAGRWARRPQVHNWTDATSNLEELPRESALSASDDPAARLLGTERTLLLERLLAELPETQADALRLRFYGELKFHEIAAAVGCSLVTAKNRVRQGLVQLAQRVQQADCREQAASEARPLPLE